VGRVYGTVVGGGADTVCTSVWLICNGVFYVIGQADLWPRWARGLGAEAELVADRGRQSGVNSDV
jgi:hypothetical protein